MVLTSKKNSALKMRTVGHSKNTDQLGRYYTNVAVSRLLVQSLPPQKPVKLLDLGAGEGALSLEASKRWNRLNLVTVDVDKAASKILAQKLRNRGFEGVHHHVEHDALRIDLKDRLSTDRQAHPEVAICNPPFLVPEWRKGFGGILEDVGFSGVLPAVTTTDAAVLFLSQSLRVLQANGTVAIIVPDSIASGEKYFKFRQKLLNTFDVRAAIKLPRGAFAGTEALAHIIVIAKRGPISQLVTLSKLTLLGSQVQSVSVDRDQAAKRLDYEYHISERDCSSKLILSDVVTDLRRGSFNSAEARAQNHFVLHTTEIDKRMRGVWFDFDGQPNRNPSPTTCITAKFGDILLSRVGRNAFEKVIGVGGGEVAISDCIYRLRVLPEYRLLVMSNLTSRRGAEWLTSHAYGVAARHLAKSDLLTFPLYTHDSPAP